MRNPRSLVMVFTSLALAAIAVFLAWRWVDGKSKVDTDAVVVASQDIDLGTRLEPNMLAVVQWPHGAVPTGAFAAVDPLLKSAESGEARVARAGLLKGEPILEPRLAPIGAKAGLSAVIAQGSRAITVRVNDVIGVAGFALPGSYVDILVNTTTNVSGSGSADKSVSKIVLERILVLAVAQELAREDAKPKVVNAVTLQVTPEEAERVDLARSVGTLSLVLRNGTDTKEVVSKGITKAQLLNTPLVSDLPPAPVKLAATEPRRQRAVPRDQVEVIRGVERSNRGFPLAGTDSNEESKP